jgi:hypothetical protein
MKVKGKRLRGRPRSRWEQQVRNDVIQREGKTWEEIEEEAVGRERWVKRPCVRRPAQSGYVLGRRRLLNSSRHFLFHVE